MVKAISIKLHPVFNQIKNLKEFILLSAITLSVFYVFYPSPKIIFHSDATLISDDPGNIIDSVVPIKFIVSHHP